jgi:hypothetical protein
MNAITQAPLRLEAAPQALLIAPGVQHRWLTFHQRSGLSFCLRYCDLLEMDASRESPISVLMLHFFPNKIVTITGRNLGRAVRAIGCWECKSLREYTREPPQESDAVAVWHIGMRRV